MDVEDGWLEVDSLRQMGFVQNIHTEKHLLRPFDVVVTARSGRIKAALVPPHVSRTVAGITLLVMRPKRPESGMGHWLWYFLTSAHGQAELANRVTVKHDLIFIVRHKPFGSRGSRTHPPKA